LSAECEKRLICCIEYIFSHGTSLLPLHQFDREQPWNSPTSRCLLATGSQSHRGCLPCGPPVNIDDYRAHPRNTKMRDECCPHGRSYHKLSQRKPTLQPFDRVMSIVCSSWTASGRRENHVPMQHQTHPSCRQWDRRESSVITSGCFDG
jgi:hypothetical protein